MSQILKISVLVPFIFATLISSSFGAKGEGILVGKVNMQRVIVSVKEGKAMIAKLKKFAEKEQKSLKKEEEEIKKMQETFRKQSLVMNDDMKIKKEREFRERALAFREKGLAYNQKIQKMENELKLPLIKKASEVIKEVSKANKVEFTTEISTTPLYFVRKELDLTEKVIEHYNKKHPVK